MERNNSTTQNISEKYRKYLIEIVLCKKTYYTISGIDASISDDDVYLSDKSNVLLFQNVDLLKEYILNPLNKYIFDRDNLVNWVKENSTFVPYAHFNFDKISNISYESLKDVNNIDLKEELLSIFYFVNFLKDLKYQFSNKKLEKILDSNAINKFSKYCYNKYIFMKEENSKLSIYPFEEFDLKLLISDIQKLNQELIYIFLIVE